MSELPAARIGFLLFWLLAIGACSDTHAPAPAPEPAADIDYELRCEDCESAPDGVVRRIATGGREDTGDDEIETSCRVVRHGERHVAAFSIAFSDEDDASRNFTLRVDEVALDGEDPGWGRCSVSIGEGSLRYSGACSKDPPSGAAPCQLELTVENGSLTGSLLCRRLPLWGSSSPAIDVVAPMSDRPVEFAFKGCGEPDLDTLDRREDGGALAWVSTSTTLATETLTEAIGEAVAPLSDGSAWLAGRSIGPITFGPGDAQQTELDGIGGFLARYGRAGELEFVERTGQTAPAAIAVLADGSTAITGGNEGGALFVARYAADGELLWTRGCRGRAEPSAVGALADGSLLVAGTFGGLTGRVVLGPDEAHETVLTGGSDQDLFIARYAGDGSLLWAKHAARTTARIRSGGMAVLPDGSALLAGSFDRDTTFGPGDPHETALSRKATLSAAIRSDVFVAKYDRDGRVLWAKRARSVEGSWSGSIAAARDGSALVAGTFFGSATFGEGEKRETTLTSAGGKRAPGMFVARYTAEGDLAWAQHGGWASCCLASGDIAATGIAALEDGSSLVTGRFQGYATFGFGQPTETTLYEARNGVFLARYDRAGKLVWAKRARIDTGGVPPEVAALADGASLLTGAFQHQGVFGPGEPHETTADGGTGLSLFVARFEP